MATCLVTFWVARSAPNGIDPLAYQHFGATNLYNLSSPIIVKLNDAHQVRL